MPKFNQVYLGQKQFSPLKRSWQQLVAMLVSESCAVTWTVLIWVSCTATQVSSRPGLLIKALVGTLALQQSESELICGSGYHWGLCRCQGSSQPHETMLVSEGHAATRAILICLIHPFTWCHGDIQVWAAVKDHVWVCCSTADGVGVNVQGKCYDREP